MKLLYIRGRITLIIVVLACFCAITVLQMFAQEAVRSVAALVSGRLVPIYSVETDSKRVAISFDAMWGTDYTDRILNILARNGVHTTFFLGGYWVEKYPHYVRRMIDEGHEIGNHSYSHPHLNSLSEAEIMADLDRNHQLIVALTGVAPELFRPPFGEYSNKVIEAASKLGYKTIQWSLDSLDWKEISADQITSRILDNVKSGDIILFHNNGTHTAEAVERIVPALRGRGFEIVPVSQLIYHDNYYIENHSGIQRPLRPKSSPGSPGRPSETQPDRESRR